MDKELDTKLVQAFPLLYSDRYQSLTKTCMYRGFECGKGWFQLIWNLSSKLEPLIAKFITDYPDLPSQQCPRATQVKEKFGTLRFYMTSETKEMADLVNKAERLSAITCEQCGQPGILKRQHWVTTLCDNCTKSNHV